MKRRYLSSYQAISTHANGNCLYNSALSLIPSLDISPIELRVRIIIELVINYNEYSYNFTENMELFQEDRNNMCKYYSYSTLYELVALCNVLGCNIRSLYSRIDYHSVSSTHLSHIYFTINK